MRSFRYFSTGFTVYFIFFLLCSPILIETFPGSNANAASDDNIVGGRALEASEVEVIPNETVPKVNDPYERFNRTVFKLNDRIYFWFLKPLSKVYAAYFPPGIRIAVRSGFHNFVFPERFINSLLQRRPARAGTEMVRFLINSTLGIGGLVDVAGVNMGITGHDADFGQTLALWGTGSGPFLMIPVLGPYNLRDFAGYGVDSVMDPLFWIPSDIWVGPALKVGKIMNNTSLRPGEYEDFKKSAFDPYIALREAYIQYREHEIRK